MRYGLTQYNADVFNAVLYTVTCQVGVTSTVGQVYRLRNATAQAAVVANVAVNTTAACLTSSAVSVTLTASIASYIRVRGVSVTATAQATGTADTTAVCVTATAPSATVFITVVPAANWLGRATANVVITTTVSSIATCFTSALAQISVTNAVQRTWVKYASFGQALVIRAANNEGFKLPSAGVLNPAHGTLEWVVEPFAVTASAARYLFDGAGVTNKNLIVQLDTDGKVRVFYGTGTSTITLTSSVTVLGDGGNWIGVGWDDTGVVVTLDGVVVASNLQKPLLEFGANVYVGCSSSQTNSLDGKLDEFRASSKRRSVAEFLAAYEVGIFGVPLEWDVDTTYLLHFDGNLNNPSVRQGVWKSLPFLAPDDADFGSLVVYWEDTLVQGSALVCQVRTSSDGQNWSYWYDTINGDYSPAPANPYAQVRFILQTIDGTSTPVLKHVVASFEGVSSTDVLANGLSPSNNYTFAQLNDTLLICNGVDLPKKFDGAGVSDVTTAPRATLVTVWRNRVFMAKAPGQLSHLFFSDILNVDSWPSTNFIAVNPSDGDEIMALLPTASTLLVVKQHWTYQLQGYSPDTFQVSFVGEGGTVSPRGIIDTPYGLFRIDREGVWATDLRRSVLISEPINNLWKNVNQHDLNKAALFYHDQRLLVAVPKAGSNYNDLVLVYDVNHKSWAVWDGWYPSCFTTYWERGRWTYLFGDSRKGNVYAIGAGVDDAGQPFEAVIETAHLPLVSEEIAKRLKWVDVSLGSANSPTEVQVTAVVDGQELPARSFTVPARMVSQAYRVYLPIHGYAAGVRISMPQATSDGPTLLSMVLTYFQQAIRPKVVL